jgi:DNA-binding CsgD family transcriptional regulator
VTSELSIVDQIYEAALVPDRWQQICDLLAAEADSHSANVITVTADQTFRLVCSPRIREDVDRFSQSPLRFQNVRPQRHIEISPFSFMRDVDIMSGDELNVDPIYNEFLRPLGLGWTMGDVILEPSGHMIIFDIIRQSDKGPHRPEDVARMNALRPDLARAALMSSRLGFQQAENMTRALSAVGLPALIIGDAGNVIASNPEMEAMAPRVRIGAQSRLSLKSATADALLQTTLAQTRDGKVPMLQSIPVPADRENAALILHFLPVKREARDIFSKSAGIVIATSVGEVGPPDLRVISGLFDLTTAEARVARGIAGGMAVDDLASSLRITRETVRTHLKRIYRKTGTTKQAELVLLLSGLGAPRG